MNGDANVGGDLAVSGNATVEKDLKVGGTSYFSKSIWNEGEEHQVEINDSGIRVGLNSTHMDAHGVYAGGHNWDESKAAMNEDGRIKGIYGSIEKDFEVGGKTTTGELEVKKNATVGGELTVGGNADFNKNVHVANNLYVDGNIKTSGSAVIKQNLHVGGDVKVDGTLSVDNVIIGGRDFNAELNRVNDRMDTVGAQAAALANLKPMAPDPDHKFSFAAAYGGYRSKKAGAVGVFYNPSENLQINASTTIGDSDNMYGAGIAWKFGKNTKAKAMKAENNELKQAVNYLIQENKQIKDKLAGLDLVQGKLAGFPDVPKDHWANIAVETLHGNGFVQGYPDGTFKGDRQMTRYEYAEMLYNALSRGAAVKREHLKKYAPELKRVQEAKASVANKTPEEKNASDVINEVYDDFQRDQIMQQAGKSYNTAH